jgi:chromosomal replication initiator protein
MHEYTIKTAESVWNNCLKFIQDNIQEQAFKTWFLPIKAIELTDNALYIQVPSKFFYEWLEEHYVSILKVALTKALGAEAKLLYKIRMENTTGNKQPYTEQLPSANRSPVKTQELDIPIQNKDPELKNPFVIPGIRNVKIESQLNSNYSFDNFFRRRLKSFGSFRRIGCSQ